MSVNPFLKPPDNSAYYHIRKHGGLAISTKQLIITAEEKHNPKQKQVASPTSHIDTPDFIYNPDFTEIIYKGESHIFGAMQSQVIKILYHALADGNPWVHGKTLLAQAGSSSTQLKDLFKRHRNWKELILSDGAGRYRLGLAPR